MNQKISSGLKTLFLVHFVLGVLFGLVYIFIPGVFFSFLGVTAPDLNPYRLIGAAVFSFGIASWLAYQAGEWDKVKILVQLEIVWPLLGALVILYGLLFAGAPAAFWINTIILAGFGLAFLYFYSKK
jgi:hypothetical protein